MARPVKGTRKCYTHHEWKDEHQMTAQENRKWKAEMEAQKWKPRPRPILMTDREQML